jgi:hypothetical protein
MFAEKPSPKPRLPALFSECWLQNPLPGPLSAGLGFLFVSPQLLKHLEPLDIAIWATDRIQSTQFESDRAHF